jgi:hypothetical protein
MAYFTKSYQKTNTTSLVKAKKSSEDLERAFLENSYCTILFAAGGYSLHAQ